jgi:hypothetical protein
MPSINDLTFETKGIPTVYCNHSAPSMSPNDIRVYLGEVVPQQMKVKVTVDKPKSIDPAIEPRICIVMSPEFAKIFAQNLLTTVDKFEKLFGPLRPPMTDAAVEQKINEP